MKKKRILVDLSATLIHHGHIRLLKKSRKYGKIIVALSTDKEVKKYKGYLPELNFKQRKEIVSSIKYVDKVIPSKWKITNQFLKSKKIDIIIRGSDHKKDKFKIKSIVFSRTRGISSNLIRKKAAKIFNTIKT
jgi:glycerol-3-phosphate cytidylyltransferase|tara:strand:+ start:123 stop:521 length:399 start_codon:yes stop_codon:yes gene_type:complete